MAELTDTLKALIVVRLATFVRPADIIKELAQDHKQKVSRQQLGVYDPNTHAGRLLRPELKALFEETRARFNSELSDIALSSAAGRARFLEQVAYTALENKQPGRAMEAVEMIAKDLGGEYGVRPGRPAGARNKAESRNKAE